MPSPAKKLNIVVVLPVGKTELKPVAPYIPMGFKGRFPVDIRLYDENNHLNTRSAIAKLTYGNKSSDILTDASGITTAFIELDGTETKEIDLNISVENSCESNIKIPIAMPVQRFVLGKLTGINNTPLAYAKIKHNDKTIAKTNEKGFFYFDYPLTTNQYQIDVQPKFGHNSFTHTINTVGEPVVLPILTAEPISPALYNKKLAVMAPEHLNDMVRNLVKPLIYSGAKVSRLNMSPNQKRPEYQAVLEANLIKDLNFVISLKTENIKDIQIRHYHSSKNGKKLADAVKNTFKESYPEIPVKSCAGSDYELGHTGATAIVIAIPAQPDENTREALVNHLSQALKTNN